MTWWHDDMMTWWHDDMNSGLHDFTFTFLKEVFPNLFIWMPRTEMGEQIVLLVEVERTDKAFEGPPVNNIKKWNIGILWLLLTSLYGKFACVPATEFSVKMFQGTQDTGWPPTDPHACLLCAPHIAISCQKPHGILHRESTCEVFVFSYSHRNTRYHLELNKKTYFCIWNFWCLLSWVREAKVLLQMGQRNCIPVAGCEGGSTGRTPLLGLFRFDFSFWRRFLRDMFFFFKPPFPVCNWSWDSDATAESLWGSSRYPRAILRRWYH